MAFQRRDNRITRGDADYTLTWPGSETMPSKSLLRYADLMVRDSLEYHGDVLDHRRDMNLMELDRRTALRAKAASHEALAQLSDEGFAWRDVARVLRVTVPAVTKWRKGAGTTGQNRLAIARLLALLDMLADRSIVEPASWLEMPLLDGVSLTGLDLLSAGRFDLVLELASAHPGDQTSYAVLDEFQSDWRTALVDGRFEPFTAEDGAVSIRFSTRADE
jgi:hypothetical protein